MRTTRTIRLLALALAATASAGCGAAEYVFGDEARAAPGQPYYDYEGDTGGATPEALAMGEPSAADDVLAQAAPPRAPGAGGPAGNQAGGGGEGGAEGEAGWPGPNAESGLPLLIYQAGITLAVYEVTTVQEAVVAAARELGGYLSSMDDQSVTVRIPARRFQEGLGRVERLGDVLHRDVQATDVSEEFRDLEARLRNAEVVRARLEELLGRAEDVEDALAVQAELARITEDIERFKGRLRFLRDRVAFSTITVYFTPRPQDAPATPQRFRLPFPWLDELGLRSLLDLG